MLDRRGWALGWFRKDSVDTCCFALAPGALKPFSHRKLSRGEGDSWSKVMFEAIPRWLGLPGAYLCCSGRVTWLPLCVGFVCHVVRTNSSCAVVELLYLIHLIAVRSLPYCTCFSFCCCWLLVMPQLPPRCLRANSHTISHEQIKVLPCGHDFHAECLDPWLQLKAMCPLCKARQSLRITIGLAECYNSR